METYFSNTVKIAAGIQGLTETDSFDFDTGLAPSSAPIAIRVEVAEGRGALTVFVNDAEIGTLALSTETFSGANDTFYFNFYGHLSDALLKGVEGGYL